MQIKDLDGNNHSWHLTGHINNGTLKNKSSFHQRAKKILVDLFPTLQILEEVPIPLRKAETLYLDFYLPLKKVCLEVHGEQHYKFVAFYHQNMLSYLRSQKRDREKIEWCEINDIRYVELPYHETETQWIERINNA